MRPASATARTSTTAVPSRAASGAGSSSTLRASCRVSAEASARIRDGHIVLFRDFADPRVLDDVIGELHPES